MGACQPKEVIILGGETSGVGFHFAGYPVEQSNALPYINYDSGLNFVLHNARGIAMLPWHTRMRCGKSTSHLSSLLHAFSALLTLSASVPTTMLPIGLLTLLYCCCVTCHIRVTSTCVTRRVRSSILVHQFHSNQNKQRRVNTLSARKCAQSITIKP